MKINCAHIHTGNTKCNGWAKSCNHFICEEFSEHEKGAVIIAMALVVSHWIT